LSVALNYIEGFARKRSAVKKNFWEISYGSLQESKYLIEFCQVEGFINNEEANEVLKMADEIGAILWRITHNNK
jgi:four helix bundle protein